MMLIMMKPLAAVLLKCARPMPSIIEYNQIDHRHYRQQQQSGGKFSSSLLSLYFAAATIRELLLQMLKVFICNNRNVVVIGSWRKTKLKRGEEKMQIFLHQHQQSRTSAEGEEILGSQCDKQNSNIFHAKNMAKQKPGQTIGACIVLGGLKCRSNFFLV